MKRNTFILLGLSFVMILSVIIAEADELKDGFYYLFIKGNSFYKEGKYQEAIDMYAQILNQGFENEAVYYNLGNAYFKVGQLGKAVLNFNRAALFDPDDSDLKANLSFARSLTHDVPFNESFINRLFFSLRRIVSLDGLSLLELVLFTAMLVLILLYRYCFNLRRFMIPLIVLFLLLYVFVLGNIYSIIVDIKTSAFVVSEEVEAKFAPLSEATKFFILYPGMKVNILEEKEGWIKIQRLDRKKGWVPADAIERTYYFQAS